MERTTINN